MKNSMLNYLYVVLYYMGVCKFFYFLNRKSQIVITWHNVINDEHYNNKLLHLGVSCSSSAFSRQLDIITSRFIVTTDMGIQQSCMITFDDGYKNNIEIAATHLNERALTGVFFIPASYFDDALIEHALWVDKVLMWISYAPEGNYFFLDSEVIISSADQSRNDLWAWCYTTILANYSVVELLLEEFDNQFPFEKIKQRIPAAMYRSRFEVMSTDELNQLKKMGHKLACHSYKHDILSLLDEKQLENDFSTCSLYSNEYNINYYSYPFGGENEVSPCVLAVCEKYGYQAAFVNYPNHQNKSMYASGRISLDNLTDKYRIEARLCGLEYFLKNLVRKSIRS